MSWSELGKVEPEDLVDARLQLHWAAQVVAAAGETYQDPVPDTSHNAMRWLPNAEALAGNVHRGARPFRVAVRPRDLNLMLLDEAGNVIDDHPLDTRSFGGAMRWVRKSVSALTAGGISSELRQPSFEIPAHPVGSGERFDLSFAAAFEELGRWFGNAASVLSELAKGTPDAGPVICWPHHLDIATLITLASERETQSVGLGLSPGDERHAAPYAYANVWPAPAEAPPYEGEGEWQSGEWVGALLGAKQLVAAGSASAQEALLRGFWESAERFNRSLLG